MANPEGTVRITTDCQPELKVKFKKWWQKNNFASESEAIRDHVRRCIEELENDD